MALPYPSIPLGRKSQPRPEWAYFRSLLGEGEAQVLRRDAHRRIERVTGLPDVRGLSVEQLLTSEYFGLYSTEDPEFEAEVTRYAALASKRDRSEVENAELEQLRQQVGDKLEAGATPQSRLVHLAAMEYVVKEREAAAAERPAVRRAALDHLLDLLRAGDTEDT